MSEHLSADSDPGESVVRTRSLAVLSSAGSELPRLIAEGRVEFGVDRTAHALVARLDPAKVHAEFGVDMKAVIEGTKSAAVLEYSSLLLHIAAAAFVFRWWALAAIAGALLLYQWGITSNVTGGGTFSLLLAVGGVVAAFQARSTAQTVWAISWAVVGVSQWARYQLPIRALKRAASQSPRFMHFLVMTEVAMLRESAGPPGADVRRS